MQRRVCYFSGRVQGVGFRYTAHNAACRFDVTGYVRNLPDGRVEMVAEGAAEEIDGLLAEIQRRMEGYIRDVTCAEWPPTGEFDGFIIRH